MAKKKTDSNAARKVAAARRIRNSSPYAKLLKRPDLNEQAHEYVVRQPLPAALIYLAYMKTTGQLDLGEFEALGPEERLVYAFDRMGALYEQGQLGGLGPMIVSEMRMHPETFKTTREAVDAALANAPEAERALYDEAEKLATAEDIAVSMAESAIDAGRAPSFPQDTAPTKEDKLSAAVTAAQDAAEHADAAAQGNTFTESDYRNALAEGLRAGKVSPAQAVALSAFIDHESGRKPTVAMDAKDYEARSATFAAETIAAMNEGKPLPVKDFTAPAPEPAPVAPPTRWQQEHPEVVRAAKSSRNMDAALKAAIERHSEAGAEEREEVERLERATDQIESGKPDLDSIITAAEHWNPEEDGPARFTPEATTEERESSFDKAFDRAWERAEADSTNNPE